MPKSNQRLVIIYGSHNSGKSFLYNLFKKDHKYIHLDFYKSHFAVHGREFLRQLGENTTQRLKKFIFSPRAFQIDFFLREVGRLMKDFPEHHFVIKPGKHKWITDEKLYREFISNVKKYCPIKPKNVKHLFVTRHPKICLATTYHKKYDMDDFISRWKDVHRFLSTCVNDDLNIVKIEELKHNELMKQLLPKLNFNNFKSYTSYDVNDYRLNIFDDVDKFGNDLKQIETNLKELLDYLNYGIKDNNTISYLKELSKRVERNKSMITPIKNQKLIIINGLLNSGKTILFDLFRKEENCICMDLTFDHHIYYEDEIVDQIGQKNFDELKPFIKTFDIFKSYIFLEKIGDLMKKFPGCHFIIKPGCEDWAYWEYDQNNHWFNMVKRYLPCGNENVHHVFVMRHPYMGWATTWNSKLGFKNFIDRWTIDEPKEYLRGLHIIKIEELKKHKIFTDLLTETNVDNVLSYTCFDLETKLVNSYDNIKNDFKTIRKELKHLMNYLNYDKTDENIQLFMDDDLKKHPEYTPRGVI